MPFFPTFRRAAGKNACLAGNIGQDQCAAIGMEREVHSAGNPLMFRTLSVIVTSTRDDPVLAAAIAVAEREGAFLSVSCLGIEPAAFMTMPMEGAVMTAGLGM